MFGGTWAGYVMSAARVFTVLAAGASAGYTLFSTLVFMLGITAAIPYGFSACPDQVAAPRRAAAARPRVARDVFVAVVAVVFSVLFIWYSRITGEAALWKVWVPFIFCGLAFLLDIPVYLAQRVRLGSPAGAA